MSPNALLWLEFAGKTVMLGAPISARSPLPSKMLRNSRGPLEFSLSSAALLIALTCAVAAPGAFASEPAKPAAGAASAPRTPEPPRHSALRYDFEYPVIGYAETPTHNAFARLQERMNRGEVKLEWRAPRGYLDSLLKALNIDKSSQALVFSKTSLEISYITEKNPRAIYFDDENYVAWVQGAPALELMAVDSVVGPVFYTLPNRDPAVTARLNRETLRCLNCHDSFALMGGGVPHFLMVSTYAGIEGEKAQRNASIDTNDATPMKNRWGGWYVTGRHGEQSHLGNIVIRTQRDLDNIDSLRKGNLDTLQGLFDTKPYITDKSDIVSLLVLQHQVTLHNLITRANFKARTIVARDVDPSLDGEPTWNDLSPRTHTALKAMLEPLVRGLLNADAVAFESPISGNSGFDAWFQKQGPRDSRGRSLRELDLRTRLFRYPLSYLIYSDGFEGLPEYAKRYVYERLAQVLRGEDRSKPFAKLSAADRQAILEILSATKPAFVRPTSGSSSTAAPSSEETGSGSAAEAASLSYAAPESVRPSAGSASRG
jgi:hypothetical protein